MHVTSRGKSIVFAIEYYLSFFLFFFLVFQFKVPFFYNSVILSFVILCPLSLIYLLCGQLKLTLDSLILKVFYLFSFYFLLLSVFILITYVVVGEGDYYRLKTMASNFVSMFVLFTFLKVFERFISFEYLCKLVVNVFFLQSIIIVTSIFVPDFRDFISLFKSDVDVEIAEKYGGIRGNALAGSQFFPMSACFAFAQLFVIALVLKSRNKKIKYILVFKFLLIAIAGLSVGRTSIIGTFLSLLLIILSFNNKSSKSFLMKIFLTITVLSVSLTPLVIKYDLIEMVERFSKFAFEFIYNLLEGDGVSTQSTDILDKMYFTIPLQNFIFGYGRFLEDNLINPYLRTDAGYMRDIIHLGLSGLFISIVMPLNILHSFFGTKSVGCSDNKLRLLWFTAVLLMYVLHYKGLVILNLVSFNLMFIVFTIALTKYYIKD